MKWVVLAVLGSVSMGSTVAAQEFFADPRAQALQIREQIVMNEDARRDFRRGQSTSNRMIRLGAPMFGLGAAALVADVGLLWLRLAGLDSTRAQLSGVAAAGLTMALSGLIMMLRGRRMRVRSEQSFDTRHLMLRDQLHEARRLRFHWD